MILTLMGGFPSKVAIIGTGLHVNRGVFLRFGCQYFESSRVRVRLQSWMAICWLQGRPSKRNRNTTDLDAFGTIFLNRGADHVGMNALLLDLDAAAASLGLARTTLRRWAYQARPAPAGFPLPVRVGRLLRYRAADLAAWVNGLPPAHEAGQAQPSPSEATPPAPQRGRGRPRKNPGGGA